jgi:hypothetical protein
VQTLAKALNDPEIFSTLVDAVEDENGRIQIIPNQQGLAHLRRDAELESIKATNTARSHFGTMAAPPPPPEPSASDYAMPTINALIQSHKIEGLTEADTKFLAGQFERYVQVSNGQKAVDSRFLAVMQDRAEMRAEQRKTATAAETAGKFNGGMNRGRNAPKPAPKPAAPVVPQKPEKVSRAKQWDDVLANALPDVMENLR